MVNPIWEMIENVALWLVSITSVLLGLQWLTGIVTSVLTFKLGITIQAAAGLISAFALWRRR